LSSDLQKEGVIASASDTAEDILKWRDRNPEELGTEYGHAALVFSQAIVCAGLEGDEANQVKYLREKANLLIERYGLRIIDFMRLELGAVLELDKDSATSENR